jgi:hypothetical protein
VAPVNLPMIINVYCNNNFDKHFKQKKPIR